MHMPKVIDLLLVLLCCECSAIKVPSTWDQSANSAVNGHLQELPVEVIKPQVVQTKPQNAKPIPVEYFEYTAQKPQFAADIAAFHGVQNPSSHYKAYPIRPYTGTEKPVLGIHHILDEDKTLYQPFQKYIEKNQEIQSYIKPTSTGYEIFHPYKAEEPGLQELYKDPVLSKIRNDLQDSKNRLQTYEQEAGKPDIQSDEYLESNDKTDEKLFPIKNLPARYEIHRPERRPVYYRSPIHNPYREHVLNQKFKHPWNQHNAKIRPIHYRPIKNHIHHLRQNHAIKYDDEQNEYPQIAHLENINETPDGYDIYEKGKQKFNQLRNNVDESINQSVKQNRPEVFQKLELQNNDNSDGDEAEEFVPIKNYAQVRKTETYKHLPRTAAFDDADTYEEIINAPRLREAVKSTKAQTVYSEEGYEDAAYDHAGEQKHASDHEGHGGFLKANENSGGLYKIPSFSGKYQDASGSEYRDQIEDGKKWKNDNKDENQETDAEDYSEAEYEQSIEADIHEAIDPENSTRNKRNHESGEEDEYKSSETNDDNDKDASDSDNSEIIYPKSNSSVSNGDTNRTDSHVLDKRHTNFKIPELNFNSTYLTESEIAKLAGLKLLPKKNNIKFKYPYYFKDMKGVDKNSPLKYAENLKFIPKKSNGGTEFYDSRSKLTCPEVDDDVDPLPDKLKNGENPTENDDDDESQTNGEKSFDAVKEQPRLKGLGDKIDCFKAKYFGENPLDSPFFKEEIIQNPEPIFVPKISVFKPTTSIKKTEETKLESLSDGVGILRQSANSDIYTLLDKLRSDRNQLQDIVNKTNGELRTMVHSKPNNTHQADVYSDVLKNMRNENVPTTLFDIEKENNANITYKSFQNKEEVTKLPPSVRKKRATSFVYEPYKIIRDSQIPDSKKTTTTGNISPLIKQLQSSRVVDRVSRSNHDEKKHKPNMNSRTYTDIGKNDRIRSTNDSFGTTVVDVSEDHRRGEPRYEVRPSNHKLEYKPVENKKSMSIDDYNSQTASSQTANTTVKPSRGKQRFSLTTVRPYYDVSQFIPKSSDIQNVAASNEIKKMVTNSAEKDKKQEPVKHPEENSEEDYEDEDDEDDDEDDEDDDEVEEEIIVKTTTTTTTTTLKPSFRKRIRPTTTTQKPPENNENSDQTLKLITRFRNFRPSEKTLVIQDVTEPPIVKKHRDEEDEVIPKYREKKKKSSKSTLVTDTKKYGDDDDDNDMKKEIDALIGVKQNMDDYMPLYEKELEGKAKSHKLKLRNEKTDNDHDDRDGNDTNDSEDDDDDDDDDDSDEDEDDNSDEDEDEEENIEVVEEKIEPTTAEPKTRTLQRTTDAPPPTVASHSRTVPPTLSSHLNQEIKPIVRRKKIEIHKELPVNKSSPHITQFKQDIKEIEIIKEIPKAHKPKPQKNVEALELYKDDDLAKDINKLGDVEIFSESVDLDKGPKHGGNYRQATAEELKQLNKEEKPKKTLRDAEASQSENTKHVEFDEYTPPRMHGGNLKSVNDLKRTRNTGRSSKLIELSDPPLGMHGGNLKYNTNNNNNNNKRRGGQRNEKLIEFDDDRDDNHPSSRDDDYEPNTSRSGPMHGGNYRSAKLVVKPDDVEKSKDSNREARRSAARLLNSFVQAAPILTTTPVYIVDPSKRMYYYVDA